MQQDRPTDADLRCKDCGKSPSETAFTPPNKKCNHCKNKNRPKRQDIKDRDMEIAALKAQVAKHTALYQAREEQHTIVESALKREVEALRTHIELLQLVQTTADRERVALAHAAPLKKGKPCIECGAERGKPGVFGRGHHLKCVACEDKAQSFTALECQK